MDYGDEPPDHCQSCSEWAASYRGLAAKCEQVRNERDRAIADKDELEALIELQRRRVGAATEAWRAEHNQPDVFPDLGELVEWLMEKAGKADG